MVVSYQPSLPNPRVVSAASSCDVPIILPMMARTCKQWEGFIHISWSWMVLAFFFLMFSVFACLCQKKNLKIWLVFLSCVQEFSLFFPLNFQLPVSINRANPRSRPSISPNIPRPTPIRNHQAEFLLRIPLPGWITRTKLEESPKTEAAYSLPMFAGDMPQSVFTITMDTTWPIFESETYIW